jgi:predicted CopG family antitoxin
MAVKTITIDLEAYETLARHKRPGQSFSQVIKAHFAPRRSAGAFRAALRELSLQARTIDAIDAVVKSRRKSHARVPAL